MKRHRGNETGDGYCPNCDKRVSAHLEDFGVGWTEAWGVMHNDVRLSPVCDECGGNVDDYEPEEYEPDWDAMMEERRINGR